MVKIEKLILHPTIWQLIKGNHRYLIRFSQLSVDDYLILDYVGALSSVQKQIYQKYNWLDLNYSQMNAVASYLGQDSIDTYVNSNVSPLVFNQFQASVIDFYEDGKNTDYWDDFSINLLKQFCLVSVFLSVVTIMLGMLIAGLMFNWHFTVLVNRMPLGGWIMFWIFVLIFLGGGLYGFIYFHLKKDAVI